MSEIIEGKPQLPPGLCFICEQSNPVRYIDTFRDFEGIVREKLDGRKYVCEECVTEFAKKFGFVTPKEHSAVFGQLKAVQDEFAKLEEAFKQYGDLKAIVESIGGKIIVEVAPKKVAATKAPAKAS